MQATFPPSWFKSESDRTRVNLISGRRRRRQWCRWQREKRTPCSTSSSSCRLTGAGGGGGRRRRARKKGWDPTHSRVSECFGVRVDARSCWSGGGCVLFENWLRAATPPSCSVGHGGAQWEHVRWRLRQLLVPTVESSECMDHHLPMWVSPHPHSIYYKTIN